MRHEFPFSIFLIAFVAYTALLFFISWLTARKAGSSSFFSGDRKAPWPIVAYGMVGASISGVTFISVPGNVMAQNFYYMPLIFGFFLGYIIIAQVLLPVYYKLNLTTIYSYLEDRFGKKTYATGTTAFMISRILGAAVRIFVVIIVFMTFIPKGTFGSASNLTIFTIVTIIFLLLLYLYTFKGGVKTIIWTDVLQTTFILLAVFLTIWFICKDMGWSFGTMCSSVAAAENPAIEGSRFSSLFDWDWGRSTNAVKQLFAGIFISTAMTGLDQGMMQKSLACKNLPSAQKNMYTTAIIIMVVNFFFLLLGALLAVYVTNKGGMAAMGLTKTDQIFPTIASQYLGVGVGVFFLIGLISSSYPSAGAAMTSLTTSFCVDFLGFNKRKDLDEKRKTYIRQWVQAGFALVFLVIVIILFLVSNDAVINLVYKLGSYTYGPLLGLFFFGILTKHKVKDGATPFIAVAAPLLCFIINSLGKKFIGFDLGFTLLIVNGLFTFFGMWLFRVKKSSN